VAVVDLVARALLNSWPLAGNPGNSPLALDPARHRLFLGARHPAQLLVLDTRTGRVVAQQPMDSDADDLFFDPVRRRVYVSCGGGAIDVYRQSRTGRYRRLQPLTTLPGARTSTFSPALDRFFLGVPAIGANPAELRAYALP
jgi:hypothetical protein